MLAEMNDVVRRSDNVTREIKLSLRMDKAMDLEPDILQVLLDA